MSEKKQERIRNPRRAAIIAIGTLSILALAAVTTVQSLGEMSSTVLNSELSPTDARHPRWAAARRDPATQTHQLRKSGGLVQSEIVPESEVPGPQGGVLRLKGISRVRARVRDLQYSWILPESLRVRAGETQGLVSSMNAGDERAFDIEVESLGPGPHRVIFRSWIMRGGEPIGNSAHFVFGAPDEAEQNQLHQLNSNVKRAQPPAPPRSPEEFRQRAIQ